MAPNLVATAGHCIENLRDCQQTQFVFDFAKRKPNQVNYEFRPQDVYSCKRILHSDLVKDFSIVELNSPVVGRIPLNIRRSGKVKENSELIMIGHPAGLPSKIAGGATVLTHGSDNFFASLDAFAGNSGSLVMGRSSGLVEGILVGGEPDYIYEDGCQKENICDTGDCFGEKVISIQLLKNWIPNTQFSPPNLENCQ